MAKRMYADVVMNGQEVNLSVRASSEKEARTKLETFPEYRGVSNIIFISPKPPRKHEREEVEMPMSKFRKGHSVNLYTGGLVFTH